jgi:hypothetical protein
MIAKKVNKGGYWQAKVNSFWEYRLGIPTTKSQGQRVAQTKE